MFAQRQAGRRKSPIRNDFASRAQHEVAPNGSRMRQSQRRRVKNRVAEKNQVEIERSRPPKNLANAPRFALDRLQRFQEFERPERRFNRRDGVRENRLPRRTRRAADRKGAPNRANRPNRQAFRNRVETFDGAKKRFVRRAPLGRQIRPERDQRRNRRVVVL